MEFDNLKNNNNKKIYRLLNKDFSSKSTPKKIGIKKSLKIYTDLKTKPEESYNMNINNSPNLNTIKRKSNILSLNQNIYSKNKIYLNNFPIII